MHHNKHTLSHTYLYHTHTYLHHPLHTRTHTLSLLLPSLSLSLALSSSSLSLVTISIADFLLLLMHALLLRCVCVFVCLFCVRMNMYIYIYTCLIVFLPEIRLSNPLLKRYSPNTHTHTYMRTHTLSYNIIQQGEKPYGCKVTYSGNFIAEREKEKRERAIMYARALYVCA